MSEDCEFVWPCSISWGDSEGCSFTKGRHLCNITRSEPAAPRLGSGLTRKPWCGAYESAVGGRTTTAYQYKYADKIERNALMDFMGSANYGDESDPEWVRYREEATSAAAVHRVLMLAQSMDRDLRHSISADDLRAAVRGTEETAEGRKMGLQPEDGRGTDGWLYDRDGQPQWDVH